MMKKTKISLIGWEKKLGTYQHLGRQGQIISTAREGLPCKFYNHLALYEADQPIKLVQRQWKHAY